MATKQVSAAEWEVLRLVHAGLRDKAIAYELGFSYFYVRTACGRIYRKLGLKNPAQQRVLAALMYERGEIALVRRNKIDILNPTRSAA